MTSSAPRMESSGLVLGPGRRRARGFVIATTATASGQTLASTPPAVKAPTKLVGQEMNSGSAAALTQAPSASASSTFSGNPFDAQHAGKQQLFCPGPLRHWLENDRRSRGRTLSENSDVDDDTAPSSAHSSDSLSLASWDFSRLIMKSKLQSSTTAGALPDLQGQSPRSRKSSTSEEDRAAPPLNMDTAVVVSAKATSATGIWKTLSAGASQLTPSAGKGSANANANANDEQSAGLTTTSEIRHLQSGGSASAQSARVWGVFNARDQPEGWRLAEVSFYEDDGCTDKLEYKSLRSGPQTDYNPNPQIMTSKATTPTSSESSSAADPAELSLANMGGGSTTSQDMTSCMQPGMISASSAKKAMDGFENTMWVASCCPCPAQSAYIGADFGTPVIVKCVLITQVPGYHAEEITLMKESGQLQVGTGSLWLPVITWRSLYPNLNRVYSGIKLDDLAVSFVKQPDTQCYGGMYGPQYVGARALQEAENACKGDKDCQGVYQQACEPLLYTVQLANSLDLLAVRDALYPPQATTIMPQLTTAPPPLPRVATNMLLPSGAFLLEGSTTEYNNWNASEIARTQYPITVAFQTFPKYGVVRMCSRMMVSALQASTEGSCLWKKTGAMINYLPYSNYEVIRNYPGLVILNLIYVPQVSDCAALCLETATCNCFQFLIRREAKIAGLNCELFSMPDDFAPPVGLRKTDGVVDIIDFYRFDTWNETLWNAQGPEEAAVTSDAAPSSRPTKLLATLLLVPFAAVAAHLMMV